jgi:hypothetical protein
MRVGIDNCCIGREEGTRECVFEKEGRGVGR